MAGTEEARVVFATNFITPYRITFYEKLCRTPGIQLLVLHGKKEKEDGRPAFGGVLSFPNRISPFHEMQLGPFQIRWQPGLVRLAASFNPNVVVTLGHSSALSYWALLIWAKLTRRKTLVWSSGWEAQQVGSRAWRFKKILTRIFLSLADHILVYSTTGAEYLQAMGVEPTRLTVCYNGLEIDPLLDKESQYRQQAAAIREQEGAKDQVVFLFVGGLLVEKKVEILLEAFADLEKKSTRAILWVVGDGPDRKRLEQLAERLQLRNVRFWGRVVEDVDRFYAAADFFVLPGTGGLALNQALFWGVPSVVGKADGTEDDLVIDGKTGFRFEADEPNSLREAMGKCLQLSHEARSRMGETGRALVIERSNVTSMVETFARSIHSLVSTSRKPDSVIASENR